LRVDGPRGVNVRLQRSTNLTDWENWQSVSFGVAPVEFSDSEAASAPRRFFRAIIP